MRWRSRRSTRSPASSALCSGIEAHGREAESRRAITRAPASSGCCCASARARRWCSRSPSACSPPPAGSSSEQLFYLYALLPLAIAFVAEQLRVASAQTILDQHGLEGAAAVGSLPAPEQAALVTAIVRREIGVMACSALVVVFLALRAAGTAHGF